MLEVCSGVTNEKEKDGVYKRSGRKGREQQELHYELSVQVCAWVRTWRFCGCELVNLIDVGSLKMAKKALRKRPPSLEGAHPLL